jgi:hypothetical protein
VDTTEIVVVKAPEEGSSLECGGHEMVPTSGDVIVSGSIHPEFSGGTQLGKRYVDGDEQVNVLCTKSGQGSLSLDGRALHRKDPPPAHVPAR